MRIAPIHIILLLEPFDRATYSTKCIDYFITDNAVVPSVRFDKKGPGLFEIIHLSRPVYMGNHRETYRHLNKPIKCTKDGNTLKCSYIKQFDGTLKCYHRKMFNLPEDAILFCNFANPFRISLCQRMFDAWNRILVNVPNSVLWLVEHSNINKMERDVCIIKQHICKNGVDPRRIIVSDFIDKDEHILGRVPLADIFLDLSFEVGNQASCLDAIWAGVPVVTLPSECLTSRVAASVLSKIDCKETIAENIEEYIKIAIQLAQNQNLLENIRSKLWDSKIKYNLFDRKSYADELETIYKRVHERLRECSCHVCMW